MKDRTFITLSVLFFILFFLGIVLVSFGNPILNTIRAVNVTPSPLKSFAVVFPQIANIQDSGGTSTGDTHAKNIKVTVVIRDENGDFLANRLVKLTSDLSAVTIAPNDSQSTNNNGQAVFYLTSSVPGTVQLKAVDVNSDIQIANIPSVDFTR